ncbi:unnamed protein product [Symbiodinium microadriaticum]|nr:unnamed protein product [Symbiodinium sp. KB8]CAE7900283.1 unnamed protein product [Symbiodinium microadriaticum]
MSSASLEGMFMDELFEKAPVPATHAMAWQSLGNDGISSSLGALRKVLCATAPVHPPRMRPPAWARNQQKVQDILCCMFPDLMRNCAGEVIAWLESQVLSPNDLQVISQSWQSVRSLAVDFRALLAFSCQRALPNEVAVKVIGFLMPPQLSLLQKCLEKLSARAKDEEPSEAPKRSKKEVRKYKKRIIKQARKEASRTGRWADL